MGWVVMVQLPPGRQHPPRIGHGLGAHIAPEVHEKLGGTGQLAWVVCVQALEKSQHAPSGMHGLLGTHKPPDVQLRLGGTGQRPTVVNVQAPLKAQHAPFRGGGGHGMLGMHV